MIQSMVVRNGEYRNRGAQSTVVNADPLSVWMEEPAAVLTALKRIKEIRKTP